MLYIYILTQTQSTRRFSIPETISRFHSLLECLTAVIQYSSNPNPTYPFTDTPIPSPSTHNLPNIHRLSHDYLPLKFFNIHPSVLPMYSHGLQHLTTLDLTIIHTPARPDHATHAKAKSSLSSRNIGIFLRSLPVLQELSLSFSTRESDKNDDWFDLDLTLTELLYEAGDESGEDGCKEVFGLKSLTSLSLKGIKCTERALGDFLASYISAPLASAHHRPSPTQGWPKTIRLDNVFLEENGDWKMVIRRLCEIDRELGVLKSFVGKGWAVSTDGEVRGVDLEVLVGVVEREMGIGIGNEVEMEMDVGDV